MAIHNIGLSAAVTGGKVLESPTTSGNRDEFKRVLTQLGAGTHYIDTPSQAFDILHKNLELLGGQNNRDFYVGVLYILGEFLSGDAGYNINNTGGYYHIDNGVKTVQNRKGLISEQVLQVLGGEEAMTIETKITDIDFSALSQSITQFVVSNAPTEVRRQVQSIKNLLIKNLGLGEHTDWTVILEEIKNMNEAQSTSQKQAA